MLSTNHSVSIFSHTKRTAILPHPERYRDIYWLHWATKDLVKFNDYKGHWPEFVSKQLILPLVEMCFQIGSTIKPLVQQTYKLEQRNATLRHTRDLLLPKLISGDLKVQGDRDPVSVSAGGVTRLLK